MQPFKNFGSLSRVFPWILRNFGSLEDFVVVVVVVVVKLKKRLVVHHVCVHVLMGPRTQTGAIGGCHSARIMWLAIGHLLSLHSSPTRLQWCNGEGR